MKKFLLFFAALCCTLLAGAFEVGGINYNITSSEEPYTVEVGNNPSFFGTTVTIPASVTYEDKTYSVTSIGESAFDGRTNLTSITIPASVMSIGTYAFWNNGLTSVTFAGGNQLTSIGMNAFSYCKFSSINIPASVTSIGDYAFSDCSSLTDVTVNWTSSIPTINANVFEGVDLSLVTLHTPPGTASFYEAATVWSSFGSIKAPTNEIWYTSSDGQPIALDNSNAFWTNTTNTYENGKGVITFSDDVICIGAQAFQGCTSLVSITIPATVTSIGESAFNGCSSLTSITIPATVTSIGESAFNGCSGLTSITIPATVTSIGESAFQGCSNLTSITIPATVTSIGESAFQGCSNLTSINIPNSVTSINQYAFSKCTGLTDVTVNWTSSIPTINANVFENVNLSNATLYTPPGTASLYEAAAGWNGFGKIKELPANEIWYTSSDGKIVTPHETNVFGANITGNTYSNGKGVITFDGEVTSIGNNAFYECSNLTSIHIPNSVESIGEYAFNKCDKLTSINIPNSVTSIGNSAFANSGLTSVTFAEDCKLGSIGNMAFSGCTNLTSIDIPNSVISIGGAFQGCSGLTSVTFAEGSKLENISNAFSGCSNLTSITIPNSVTSIGYNAFRDCSSLTNVTLPSSVTSIEEQVFNGCSGLTNIHIPNSVTSIEMGAFYGCSSLTSIAFHSLPSVGSSAFGGCNALSNVTLDLTDSEKPYIGTSLDNYPNFTKANYTRTIAPNKWGTIVLPFVPESTTGLEFYALSSMTTGGENGGSLTFTKVDEIEAGKPYLFRNTSGNADFTLTKTSPTITVATSDQTADDFSMKGSFQQTQLDGATNTNLYYLSNDQFWHANGKINIAPFRAYIEGGSGNASEVKSFVLMIEDSGTVNAIPGILTEDGDIDETEGIYDLNGRKLDAPQKGQVNIIRTKSGKTVKRMF